MTNPNDPAFPPEGWHGDGLTKREWFAGMALLRFHLDGYFTDELNEKLAKQSVAMADALIAELSKEKK